jgi:hypothetical protein
MGVIMRLLLGLLVVVMPIAALANDPFNAPKPPTSQASIEETLRKAIPEVKLNGAPFSDVIDFLRDITGANITTDAAALKMAGVTAKTPVTLSLRDVPLQAALDKTCEAAGKGETKLLAGPVGNRVIITTAPRLESAKKQHAIDAAKGGAGDPAKLNRVLPEVNASAIALGDVVDFLRDVTGANIFVNWRALEAAGVTKSTPVSLRVRQMPFHECLRIMLNETNAKQPLDFNVDKDNIITVSTGDVLPKK